MKKNIFLSVAFGFLSGVLVGSLFHLTLSYAYLCIGIACSVLFYFVCLARKEHAILLLSLFFFAGSLGIIRFYLSDIPLSATQLFPYSAQRIVLSGLIIDEPDVREGSIKLHVDIREVDSRTLQNPETILVTASPYGSYHYGDEISLEGTLALPQNFTNDLGKSFDYISYLRKDGISFEMKDPEVTLVSSGQGSFIKRNLLRFKEHILEKISAFIHPPESSLLGGLLLGTKQSLGAGLKDNFVKTGTIHIVALSGYNVTIVAEWIMKLFGMVFAATLATSVGIVAIIFFAVMTGGGSTVLRASIMAILVLVARATGRNYEIGRALLLAAVAMIAINPWTLAYDVSFQLSFLATVGLIYLAPKIKHWFRKLPEKYGIQDLVNSTVATNIFVMPFIVYQMGIFSLVALPANFLILPIIPLTMLFGFLTIVAGSILPLFGQIIGLVAFVLLGYELAVIRFFGNLPFASISISHSPFALVIILYILLLFWMFKPDNNKSPL